MKKKTKKTRTTTPAKRGRLAKPQTIATPSVSGRPQADKRRHTFSLPPVFASIFGDLFPAGKQVPAALMVPRMVLVLCSFFLLVLGLVMVYSASMIKGLLQDGQDPQSFLIKQVLFTGIGLIFLTLTFVLGYKRLAHQLLAPLWIGTVLLLLVVTFFGTSSHGAARWIPLGAFSLQPSEFAKIVVVLTAANLLAAQEGNYRYNRQQFWSQFGDNAKFWVQFLVGVGLPMILILIQPDKGTTLVLGITVLLMMWMGTIPPLLICSAGALLLLAFILLSLKDDYSRQRFLTMLDPFEDPSGDGYQLIQGFYAFGSGGLFGLGLGLGRQKYSYLPEAHNDFIFPVIGEELGLIWCLGVLAAFAGIFWAGIKIAIYAPDRVGQLSALGCTLLIIVQTCLNICGVLGIFPLTGKAVPFLSYGGSSALSTLIIVGILLSVSAADGLPQTASQRLSRRFRVVEGKSFSSKGTDAPQSAYNGQKTHSRAKDSKSLPARGMKTKRSKTR